MKHATLASPHGSAVSLGRRELQKSAPSELKVRRRDTDQVATSTASSLDREFHLDQTSVSAWR